jgi:hypothetical protein
MEGRGGAGDAGGVIVGGVRGSGYGGFGVGGGVFIGAGSGKGEDGEAGGGYEQGTPQGFGGVLELRLEHCPVISQENCDDAPAALWSEGFRGT